MARRRRGPFKGTRTDQLNEGARMPEMARDALFERLDELVALAEIPMRLERSRGSSLDEFRLTGYVLGAVAAGRELGQGVRREADSGAPANSLRLARHLFELDIELNYVVAEPERHFEQLLSLEAKNRLAIARSDAGTEFEDESFRRELKRRAKQGHRAQAKAAQRRDAGECVPADELGWPSYEDKARALDRLDDYATLYGPASWIAHPGFVASEVHLDDSADIITVRPGGGSRPEIAQSALALAVVSLYRVISAADAFLGPIPGVADSLAAIRDAAA